LPIFNSLSNDLRQSLRQLKRSPGFSLMAVGMLAAGIGASAAMFTVVDQVLLRSMPYRNPMQLVQIKEAGKKGPSMFGAPFVDIEQWRNRSRTLQSIAFHTYDKPTSFLEGISGPVQVNTPRVSKNLFSTLGVRPAIGRDFEDRAGNDFGNENNKTAVLSDAVWRDGFGADPDIVGRVVRLNGVSYTVIGVMPRGFQFPFNPEKPQLWIRVELSDSDKVRTKNEAPDYRIIGRLSDGATIEQATAELKVIQSEVAKLYTDAHARENVESVDVRSYRDSVVEGSVRKALLALLAAAGVLWLIGCVNVTGLMLARAGALRRELAVRAALGATRWRIVRQLLVQGLLLSGAACLLGLGLVYLSLNMFESQVASQINVHIGLEPNGSLIFGLLALTIASAAISSVGPALVAANTPIEPALRQGSVQSGGGTHQRARGVLVVTQVAMSLSLLVACGLLLRTIFALQHVSLGFTADHVIVADMVIPAYKFDGRNMTTALYQPLVERIEHLSGVQAASLTTAVPLGKRFPIFLNFATDEKDPDSVAIEDLQAQFRAVGPGLQRVFGFRMLRGRFFNDGDTAGSPPVVVVNRAFVKAYFGDHRDPAEALGKELLSYDNDKLAHIVGVIDDEHQESVLQPSQPEVEVCIPQITPASGFYRVTEGLAMNLAVRTERTPDSIVPELRQIFRTATPELAGSTFTTMDQVVDDSYGDRRIASRLLQFFGGSALLLSVVGLYGLLAYLVTQRTHEMGVRLALGAQKQNLIWLVMRQAVFILIVGSAAGLIVSLLATRLMSNMLFGVKPYDPLSLLAASLLLAVTGLLAAFIPARRAANVNPIQALRAE
jgi:predicted permease